MQLKERECAWILSVLFVSKILFVGICRFVNGAGSAGWLQAIWCSCIAFVLFLLTAYLYKPFEGASLPDIFELALGKIGKLILGGLLTAMLLFQTAVMLRIYTNTISTLTLFQSPVVFVMLFLVATMAVSAYAGISTLGRVCAVFGTGLTAILLLLFLCAAPGFSADRLFPILGKGVASILTDINGVELYADLPGLFLLSAHLPKDGAYLRAGRKAYIGSGVAITLSVFLYELCVGYPASARFHLPMLEIASGVSIDIIFQRTEGIFLVLWIFAAFLLLGLVFSFTLEAFCRTFSLSDRRAVIPLLLAIVMTAALLLGTGGSYAPTYYRFSGFYTIASYTVIPLLLFLAKMRKKRRKQE